MMDAGSAIHHAMARKPEKTRPAPRLCTVPCQYPLSAHQTMRRQSTTRGSGTPLRAGGRCPWPSDCAARWRINLPTTLLGLCPALVRGSGLNLVNRFAVPGCSMTDRVLLLGLSKPSGLDTLFRGTRVTHAGS